MARTRRTISITEKIEAKKAEIAKVEEKLAKLQNELKEFQTVYCIIKVQKVAEQKCR